MGGKTFPLVNTPLIRLNASIGLFLIPFLFSINDIITEVYGPERTRGIIRSGLVIMILLLVFSLFATMIPPSMRFAKNESAYDLIFMQSARISFASLFAFGFADLLDVVVFVKIRKLLGKKALWMRNNASNFVAQFFDTGLFITLAFYDLSQPFVVNTAFLFSLIIPYWLLKCGMSIITTPLVYLGVKWLKQVK